MLNEIRNITIVYSHLIVYHFSVYAISIQIDFDLSWIVDLV